MIGLAVPALGIPAVGIIIGIVMLVIAFAFVELVAPSVGMWINRSILGYHRGQVEEFKNADEERASLDMVFRGVTVELTWENALNAGPAVMPHMMPAEQQPARVSGYPAIAGQNEPEYTAKRIALKVTVPKLDEVYIALSLDGNVGEKERPENLYRYELKKEKGNSGLAILEAGKDPESNAAPISINTKDDSYGIEIVRTRDNSTLGNGVRLSVVFQGAGVDNERKQDVFTIHF